MTMPVLAALVVIVAVTIYVLMDGFDLGVGSLLIAGRDQEERDEMVESIVPVWDGNETWLILLGVTLLAAFPLAYSTLLPALYLPIIVMLISLGFRGVSFEFRSQTTRYRRFWDMAFGAGSIVAALCQGLILGNALMGHPAPDSPPPDAGRSLFSVFALLVAATTLSAYTMLGTAWLQLNAEGRLKEAATNWLRRTLPVFVLLACVTAALLVTRAHDHGRLTPASTAFIAILAAGSLVLAILCWRSIGLAPIRARVAANGLVALCLVGIVTIVWPYIVPYSLTIWDASSPPGSQLFLLIGVALFLPAVFANAVFVYRTFRRKPPAAESR